MNIDVAVVGAGVVGLAHAYVARRQGLRTAVFERSPRAMGASIRNFGMIWPVGQPAGDMYSLALRSREVWGEILGESGQTACGYGSLHAARTEDEAAVLSEFVNAGAFQCEWLDADEACERSPALRRDGLLGALWSPTELIVDPRRVIAALGDQLPVTFGTAVTAIDPPYFLAGGEQHRADRIVVCGGDDFATLYPSVFANSGITRCKLQMLRTAPQPEGWRMGPGLAAGLTLCFYPSFGVCPSMPALARRFLREMPDYDRWGIHVLASQTADGAVTIGDSHEYSEAVDIFDKPEIDDLILRYFDGFCELLERRIAQRWHGVYAKHPDLPYFYAEPHPQVQIVTATGGSGMTLSFGIAERTLDL